MGSPIVTLRVVFDTNTVVSALLFSKGRLAWLRTVWRQGTIVPLISKATTKEIIRVLAYLKFHLDATDREELLGDFLPFAEVIDTVLPTGEVPDCRDKHDRIFLELAVAGEADVLVTGDEDLLVLVEESPIPIMTPANFHRRIGIKQKHR
jgi:putative PIN family toxin of toxin-antitoxin system